MHDCQIIDQGRGLYYLPKFKAKEDNTNQGLENLAIIQKFSQMIV